MDNNDLAEAKRRLRIPELWRLLNLPGQPGKSCRSPWRDDHNPSFSVFEDGCRWRDFGADEGGDAIDFLARARSIAVADAIPEFKKLAGITPGPGSGPTHGLPLPFDWQACVAALTPEHRHKVAKWRAYSDEFVDWLHGQSLIGLFEGERIAFPVHNTQRDVCGCHYRLKDDGSWRYHPAGTRTSPLVVGAPASAKTVLVFESQWDLLAVLDSLQHHIQPLASTAALATRGASNGRLLAGLCAPDAAVYAFGQNDEAGQRWLAAVTANCGRRTFQVVTPSAQKDCNDWTRAGATRRDIEAAMACAQPITPSSEGDLPSAMTASKQLNVVPEHGDDPTPPTPFPIECLPPKVALMVRGVATAHRVPDCLPGVMALALVAASCGKGLVFDWRPGKAPTPANIFAMVSALSGSGKSECSKLIAKPFLGFERGIQERWRAEVMPKLQADLRFHEVQLKKLDRKLAKDSTTAEDSERYRSEMVYHQAQVDVLKLRLHEPQLSIQDATVEKVATVMHHNDETIFSTSSDARKLCDNLLGRYSANKKLADDGIYLNAFSGDDVKVDRQGRDPVRLANPCMTLLWALQPDALEMLLDEDSLQQSGFLARCLLAHSNAEPQHIGGDERPISDEVRTGWELLICDLLKAYRQPPALAASQTETMIKEA